MKLHEMKRNSKILCKPSDGSDFVVFKRIDGMYSLCVTEKGNLCHLYACTTIDFNSQGELVISEG